MSKIMSTTDIITVPESFKRKGYYEVISRYKAGKLKGKIREIRRIYPENENKAVDDIIETITNKIEIAQKEIQKIDRVQKQLFDKNTRFDKYLGNIINKGFYGIAKGMSQLQALSWINVGLSAANLVMSVVQLSVMINEFNKVNRKLEVLQGQIKKIGDKETIDILTKFKDLASAYIDFKDCEERGEPYTETQLKQLMDHLKSVLDYLYSCFIQNVTTDADALLEAIYAVIPMYADVLCKYDTEYYFNHRYKKLNNKVLHNEHDSWMELLEKFYSPFYLDHMQDYCFLNKGINNRETMTAVFVSAMLAMNAKQIVEDHDLIIQQFETKEEFLNFDLNCEIEAVDKISNEIKEIDEDIARKLNQDFDRMKYQLSAMH